MNVTKFKDRIIPLKLINTWSELWSTDIGYTEIRFFNRYLTPNIKKKIWSIVYDLSMELIVIRLLLFDQSAYGKQ